MYAQSMPSVSPAPPLPASALAHTPAELTLISCDDITGIVGFSAPSHHDAARTNIVLLDTTNGATLCNCEGEECGRTCWHVALVVQAWERTQAAYIARQLSPVALYNAGRKAGAMVAIYRQRIGRALPDDALTLVASRYDWRRRAALAAEAPLAA